MKIYDNIVNILLNHHIIEDADVKVCKLGLQIIISDIINILCIILIGCFVDKLLYSLIYIMIFCGIRKFSGGFHAKTFMVCRMTMISVFIATLVLERIFEQVSMLISILCIIFAMITMIVFSPIIHPNRSLTKAEIRANRFVAILMSFICSVTALFLLIYGHNEGLYISLILFAIAVLIYIGKFYNTKNQTATKEFNNVNTF